MPIAAVRPIIGMEVHVELATRSKMFSRAPNPGCAEHADALPNTLIDPVVLALPGALPVMNRRAVDMALAVGMALGCQSARFTKWDRKSYFYPDLPKAYQISQYDLPLCFDGAVDLPGCDERGNFDPDAPGLRVGIIRVHLEEDAGKLLHEAPGGGPLDGSIVDWNRAGAPLVEIVTQPDFASADQCVLFAKTVRTLCRFLGVTLGVLEKGHLRFEPNVNCELTLDDGRVVRTPIVEVKNLNSYTALKRAVEHEIAEQPARWLADRREMGPGMKTTRGWDDVRGVTVPQRSKEDAHDYRYFPDPDLPPVAIDEAWRARVAQSLPELPVSRMRRYARELSLSGREAQALVEERAVCELFEGALDALCAWGVERVRSARVAANLVLQAAARLAHERGVDVPALGLTAPGLAALGLLRERGRVNNQAVEILLPLLPDLPAGDAPAALESLAGERGLLTVRDERALEQWVERAIAENPQAVKDVREGKQAAMGRLVGAVMRIAGGQADGRAVREALLRRLGGG